MLIPVSNILILLFATMTFTVLLNFYNINERCKENDPSTKPPLRFIVLSFCLRRLHITSLLKYSPDEKRQEGGRVRWGFITRAHTADTAPWSTEKIRLQLDSLKCSNGQISPQITRDGVYLYFFSVHCGWKTAKVKSTPTSRPYIEFCVQFSHRYKIKLPNATKQKLASISRSFSWPARCHETRPVAIRTGVLVVATARPSDESGQGHASASLKVLIPEPRPPTVAVHSVLWWQ